MLRIASGDLSATAQLSQEFGPLGRPERSAVLDCLAGAATTSGHCLQGLLRLIDEHRLAEPAIRSVLYRQDQVDQIDDVRQEVLVAVSQAIERFEGRATFSTWLYSLARFKAIDHLRRDRLPDRLDLDEASGASHSASSMIASQADLVRAINRLAEPYRSVVLLRDVEHRSYDEISQGLAIDLGTVKSRLSRGRSEVRRMMGA